MKIGIFDSGIGGLSVVNAIKKELPDLEIVFKNDSDNLPYGIKTPDQIYKLIKPIFDKFIKEDIKVIVVACNTVSTTLINKLRDNYPKVSFVAMEPMIKPASKLSRSGSIVVCATPTTLASMRYKYLKENYAQGLEVLEPDCSKWAYLIEHQQMSEDIVRQSIEPALEKGADVVVLGCTHYHWIENLIKQITDKRAVVIQPEVPVIKQLKRVLERLA